MTFEKTVPVVSCRLPVCYIVLITIRLTMPEPEGHTLMVVGTKMLAKSLQRNNLLINLTGSRVCGESCRTPWIRNNGGGGGGLTRLSLVHPELGRQRSLAGS